MLDRSQRRRAATRAEIKAAAREQLVKGGPGSVSLRAVARDMGLTAPALYRYYPALDSLILGSVSTRSTDRFSRSSSCNASAAEAAVNTR